MTDSFLRKRIYKYRIMYLFLLPAVVFSLVFCYRPMVGVIMAFQEYDIVHGMFQSPFIGFANFVKFLTNPDFYIALKNTLGLNILSILIGFPLPIALSILIFSMKDTLFKKVTQTISYLPHFISWVVVAGMMYKILDPESGIINILLQHLGGQPIAFMREPAYFWTIIIITSIWKELGWNTIIYLAALSGIDNEQYEAATVDGCNGFQKIIYITLPGLAPMIGLMLIFTMGSLISSNSGSISLDAIYNMRNPLVSSASDTLDYFIYQQGVLDVKFGYSAAMGLTQSIIALLLVLGSNSLSRKIRGYGAF